jgi:hypothetical protein
VNAPPDTDDSAPDIPVLDLDTTLSRENDDDDDNDGGNDEASSAGTPAANGAKVLPLNSFACLGEGKTSHLDEPVLGEWPDVTDHLPGLMSWFAQIPAADPFEGRLQRLRYLTVPVTDLGHKWRAGYGCAVKAGVALAIIIDEGLYQDFLNAEGKPRFIRRTDFVREVAQLIGLGDSSGRLSRLVRGGQLWLRLQALGFPPPPNLSRIESLIPLPENEAVAAYQAAMAMAPTDEEKKMPPTYTALQAVVENRSSVAPNPKSLRQKLSRLLDEFEPLMAQGDQAAMKEKFIELRALIKPVEKLPVASKKKKDSAVPGPTPFVFCSDAQGLSLELTDPPCRERLVTALAAVDWPSDAGVRLWIGDVAQTTWRAPYPENNPAQKNARVHHAKAIVCRLCRELNVVEPTLTPR